VTFQPADPKKWDATFLVGWLSRNKSDVAPDWNDWYDAASFAVSLGYYWTPHLKAELELSATTPAALQADNVLFLPGDLYPYYRPREHRFQATQAGASLVYQFLENRWFHPFVAGGVMATRETERAREVVSIPVVRGPLPPVAFPPLDPIDRDAVVVHPFAGAGFKAYLSERAFIRTDVRVGFSTDDAEWMVWRGGVGFDF
jgi:hypothetical protein